MSIFSKEEYQRLKAFWNEVFAPREDAAGEQVEEDDWKKMAPSAKLLDAVTALGGCRKVLDYGCGAGWAGIAAAKAGCPEVTCADVSRNAVDLAEHYAALFGVDDRICFRAVSDEWIGSTLAEQFDGLVVSNVIDLLPEEISDGLIGNLARVLMSGAPAVIGMNYYMVPQDDPSRDISVQNGNEIYIGGVLRLLSRTDEDWNERLGRYFRIDALEHFAWEGEASERRRLFLLTKK